MDQEFTLIREYNLKQKIAAIWAFSEAVIGGFLHAIRIPFTGLILGGLAVIFLTLLSSVVEKKRDILKVTSIVIAIKFILSPNTPFAAYVAVFIQGFFAFLFFSIIKNRSVVVILLSLFNALWSVFQKIILTTIIFGMNFWYSLDSFFLFLSKSTGLKIDENFSFSIILITGYFIIHLLGAFLFARFALILPEHLNKNAGKYCQIINDLNLKNENGTTLNQKNPFHRKKKWYQRPSRIMLLVFLILVGIITYINPELSKIKFIDFLSMVIRAFIIIFIYLRILAPALTKLFSKILKKNSRLNEINEITSFFPEFKSIVSLCWELNSSYSKLARIKNFLNDSLMLLLLK